MMRKTNIVVLDGYTMNPGDLSWKPLEKLGATTIYDRTSPTETVMRARDAEIVMTNKVPLTRAVIEQLPKLRCILILATGYNIVDLEAARERGIIVCNARGYSTNAVAQHTFALILELVNRTSAHHQSVQERRWSRQPDFSYTLYPIRELDGKSIGIYGLGEIGKKVALIAKAFGMEVAAFSRTPENHMEKRIRFLSVEELFATADIVTLHAPLGDDNREFVNESLLRTMKPTSLFINTARGGLVCEADLRRALLEGWIAGAGLDVLGVEPPPVHHPLFDIPNCIITPHNAWSSVEARTMLMKQTLENTRAYLDGRPLRNVL